MNDRCEQCGRRFDRPGFDPECSGSHPDPDQAQRIADAIEMDLNDRRGIGFDDVDDDIQDDIRDAWAGIIRKELLA